MNILRILIIGGAIWLGMASAHGGDVPAQTGWSADLLNQILKAESKKSDPAAPSAATGEMLLRTYHLAHLRVGEAGKTQNVLTILGKLLPPGSSMNTDVPANSIHVLTTPSAHAAIWDYLSAVDVADAAATPVVSAVPEDVEAALRKLAEMGDQSGKLLNAIGALKSDVAGEIASIDARQRRQTAKLVIGGVVLAGLLVVTVAWMLRRRDLGSKGAPMPESAALALAPDQLATALAPVHDKVRNDMLGLLNEVAIKLQAQHNEQQKLVHEQQKQLEDARLALADERRQFITEAGTMVVQAVERVDATTAKLAKQQDKVADLVEELQSTVRELDHTKDSLRTREIELEQERAKIAALSILLEEGGPLPARPESGEDACNGHGSMHNESGIETSGYNGDSTLLPCMNPEPMTLRTNLRAKPDPATPARTTARFQFLPPDQPEN